LEVTPPPAVSSRTSVSTRAPMKKEPVATAAAIGGVTESRQIQKGFKSCDLKPFSRFFGPALPAPKPSLYAFSYPRHGNVFAVTRRA